jgi:threonine dehydratase
MSRLDITPEGIAAAHEAIEADTRGTPLLSLEGGLVLKDETATPIGSFKGRGTQWYAARHAAANPVVVCASAGNFGQGLARAMAAEGGRAVVFAAETANAMKLDRMRALGAEVVLSGHDFDAANEAARAHAEAEGLPFLEDAAFAEIAEGAGTIAKEMTEAGVEARAIYVPVGGGALVNGIGTWLKAHRPETRVIGVVAEGAPAAAASWRAGRALPGEAVDTIADGIAIRVPAPAAVEVMARVVDGFVTVTDAEIVAAMRWLHRETGVVAEPAGAAGIAAARRDGGRAASVICGGNVAPDRRGEWFGA